MTDGPSSEFIDNTDVELREVFRKTLTDSEEARVAAGYFRLSGFAPLAAPFYGAVRGYIYHRDWLVTER